MSPIDPSMIDAAGMAGMSVGIPPLNLSQGPSTSLSTSDGTQTGSNSGVATSGEFVFKGTGSSAPVNLWPVALVAGAGGLVWLFIRNR